jgi:hypothetical protein
VRERDPRRLLARRRQALARVRIVDVPESGQAPDGSVTSRQTAEVTLPCSDLDRIWTPEYLERLARTYWRFMTRVSLGTLRVLYTPDSREVVALTRPFVLLRFRRPEYEIDPNGGSVTWRIERGLLVAPAGRGKGFLRISVRRPSGSAGGKGDVTVTVSSEVASFYPMIAEIGPNARNRWFSRVGLAIYRATQLRLHVIVTHAFLRSLARMDLAPSVVGALRPPKPEEADEEPLSELAAPTAASAKPGKDAGTP